jgi:Rod binding domain-containing protein
MNITLGGASAIGVDQVAARQAKLVDAAHQFEGVLLGEMLKSMQTDKDGMSSDSDSGDEDKGSSDTLRSYGTEAVAKAISQGGGFGIAKQIIAKVTKEDKHGDHKAQISK